jgi:hypothetical protein
VPEAVPRVADQLRRSGFSVNPLILRENPNKHANSLPIFEPIRQPAH